MNQKIISFNRKNADHYALFKLHNDGYRVICPVCQSDIFFSKNAGSWCSKDTNHYENHIYRDTGRRKEYKEWAKKETINNLRKKGYTDEQIQAELDKYYPNVD